MPSRFIDSFDVILLDMFDTFMFAGDRFGEGMAATYARIGGRNLSPERVQGILGELFQSLWAIYITPSRWERFPTVREHLATMPQARELPDDELALLEHTFALHEVGSIPAAYAAALKALRRHKHLGVIGDVWSDGTYYLEVLEHAGVRQLMDVMVFSSDHGVVKPTQRLFDLAASHFSCERSRMVYVGDYFNRDVVGAKKAGMAAVWINAKAIDRPDSAVRPDLEIRSLLELHEA